MFIKKIGNHDLPIPERQTKGAAGYDLQASDDGFQAVGRQRWAVCGQGEIHNASGPDTENSKSGRISSASEYPERQHELHRSTAVAGEAARILHATDPGF